MHENSRFSRWVVPRTDRVPLQRHHGLQRVFEGRSSGHPFRPVLRHAEAGDRRRGPGGRLRHDQDNDRRQPGSQKAPGLRGSRSGRRDLRI